MERYAVHFFVALALAFGLGLEILKDASPVKKASFRFSEFKAEDYSNGSNRFANDSRPVASRRAQNPRKFSASNLQARVIKKKQAESEASGPKQIQVSLAGLAPNGAPVGDKKAKDADAKKKDEDKEKKDADKKKKKKKKKTIEGKGEEKTEKQPEEETDANKKIKDSAANRNQSEQSGPPMAGYAAAKAFDNGEPQTIEEWQAHLFLRQTPSFERMSRFIQLHQTGAVPGSVYYPVVQSMLEDVDMRVRELGVMGLGAAPSARSFVLLLNVMNNTPSGTRLRRQAEIYLRNYARLDYIRFLSEILVPATDASTSLEAMRMLELAADTYLKLNPQSHQTGNQPGELGTPGPSRAEHLQRYFTPALSSLGRLIENSSDSSVRQAADQTLSNLQTLIASNPSST